MKPKARWYGLAVGAALAAAACTSDKAEPPTANVPLDLTCPDAPLSPAPLRRLTRFEYANAVRDVFGVDLPIADLFPRDEVALGFDDQAGALSLTDLHVTAYLETADTVAEWLSADSSRLDALLDCAPEGADCARRFISSVGRRLTRRGLADAEVDALVELFGGDFSTAAFGEGASRVVATLLQHPEFLYRVERATSANSPRELASPWLLASRLSFLFWGSVPDDALLERAANGELGTAGDVEREARRMLLDARARRGVLHFFIQWLDLSSFDEVEKDSRLFKLWDESLRSDLGRETERFLEAVLWEDDARLETLLTAPYSFADAVLADFYDMTGAVGNSTDLVRLDFPSDVARRGILTQGSILSRQAKANQTDPIHRGKFVRQAFFCATPPPPPANLVVSPPRLDPRKTTRERFAEHRADSGCASCHELLDPVGFIFEHYDAIGHYRATEADLPVDSSGYLAGTDVEGAIDGVPELAAKLARSDQVQSCVVKQWFRYVFSRGETEADSCTLGKLEQSFKDSKGNLGELLVALTQTDPFLYATPAPLPDEEQP
jgi:hypothetical protein